MKCVQGASQIIHGPFTLTFHQIPINVESISLFSVRCYDLKCANFKHNFVIDSLNIQVNNILEWKPRDLLMVSLTKPSMPYMVSLGHNELRTTLEYEELSQRFSKHFFVSMVICFLSNTMYMIHLLK